VIATTIGDLLQRVNQINATPVSDACQRSPHTDRYRSIATSHFQQPQHSAAGVPGSGTDWQVSDRSAMPHCSYCAPAGRPRRKDSISGQALAGRRAG